MSEQALQRGRVVVTGRGLVTPVGRTVEDIWERCAAGAVPARCVDSPEFAAFSVSCAAPVSDFEPRKEIKNRKLLRLMIGGEPLGFVAAGQAFAEARLTPELYPSDRAGIAIGCHKEGFRDANLYDAIDAALRPDGSVDREQLIADGIRRIPPQTLVEGLANAALYYLAHEFLLQGVNHNFISSGTGGSQAIGEAMRSLRRDEADLMLAGSYDTWLDWKCLAHQRYIDVLTTTDGPPETAQRPFDRHRSGSVPGEGAGLLILEERHRAKERGADIHGEILGFALGTGISPDDRAAQAAHYAQVILRAIEHAQCNPADIDLVHLQGDGTIDGDWLEVHALKHALGTAAAAIPVTSIKSVTGHLGNASGPVELIMTCEMLRRGEILPIANLQDPAEELELDFVREPRRDLSLRRALVLQRSWPCHCTATVLGPGD